MIISIIVAAAQNNVIGKENKLPWHLSADMKYFKATTMGHHIIMGRSTWETLGKPLTGRTNIVVTRQQHYKADGCVTVSDLKSAFTYARERGEQECFIIGGGDIFRQSFVWADKIYLTSISHNFEGDTFFPQINTEDWLLISEQRHLPDQKNRYAYAFKVYELNRK